MGVSLTILGIVLGSALLGAAVHLVLRFVHKRMWRAPLESILDADESDQQQLVRYGLNAVRGIAGGLEDLSIPDVPTVLKPVPAHAGKGVGDGPYAASRVGR